MQSILQGGSEVSRIEELPFAKNFARKFWAGEEKNKFNPFSFSDDEQPRKHLLTSTLLTSEPPCMCDLKVERFDNFTLYL